ncbi:MAG: transporter [Gammaproteobacteria bacterium]|nr:transporter [Gammaproteobacteria bacterium]
MPEARTLPSPPGATRNLSFVSIENLSKEYLNDKQVIRDLSLTVRSGEFVSLLGASGCGKSTLLKMIAGLSSISGGSIEIDGMIPKNARGIMSFVFQDATLLPWRTVARNVELALEFEGYPRPLRAARVDSVLKLVGLSEVGSYYPRQLSGGMKMRVSIARALATTPHLLLMDEPFAALDAMTRNRLNEELLVLKEKQRWTTLFVTHSVAEAVFLSDRIFLMSANPGRVVQEIAVPLALPRTAELRSEPAFLSLVGQVSRAQAAIQS